MHLNEPTLAPVLAKVAAQALLNHEDQSALLALPCRPSSIASGSYLVRDGEKSADCCVLLNGFTYASRTTAGGGRQIVAIQMRGDIVNLQNSLMMSADHDVQALTQADIAYIPHQALLDLIRHRPQIGQALWRQTLVDASIAFEWMINIGRRNARQRVSHFICEYAQRQQAASLSAGPNYWWPITQQQVADATGLTPVHVNRTMQGLRGDRLIHIAKQVMCIPDWTALRRAAHFKPAYLHQNLLAA